jgi:hypothetical protein
MENIQFLPTDTLVDMLARDTSDYLKMLSQGAEKDVFTACLTNIRRLQAEILSRRSTTEKNKHIKYAGILQARKKGRQGP